MTTAYLIGETVESSRRVLKRLHPYLSMDSQNVKHRQMEEDCFI